MEKALKLLKILRDDYIHGELDKDINEAINELEAINLTRREWYQKGFNEAIKPKTCEWCSNLEDIGKSYKHCKELCINISHSTESTFYCNRYEAKG
jgi:hypothetical protein